MGVLDRFERGIEKAVNGAFARAFKSEVQPVEIASSLRRAMDDRAAVVGRGRTLVPNAFVVELGPTDFARLTEYAEVLSDELVANVSEHADAQQYVFPGPVTVGFEEREGLDTGVFQVRTATVRGPAATPPAAQPPAPPTPAPAAAGPAAPAPFRVPAPVPAPFQGPFPAPFPASAPAPYPAAPVPAQPHQPAQPAQAGHIPAARRPWLDVDGHAYPLLGPVTVVGRGDDADVVIDDPGVSRRHVEIRVTTDGPHLIAHLRDLSSTNGTFIDGSRVTGAELREGNSITLGRTRLTFRSGER
jgi:Protein of unknown function (DUF3662)/FHA domain